MRSGKRLQQKDQRPVGARSRSPRFCEPSLSRVTGLMPASCYLTTHLVVRHPRPLLALGRLPAYWGRRHVKLGRLPQGLQELDTD